MSNSDVAAIAKIVQCTAMVVGSIAGLIYTVAVYTKD